MRSFAQSGGPYEAKVGYSRAVRVANQIEVAGTTASQPDGSVFGKGDAYQQAGFIFKIIEKALKDVGSEMTDVVRTRMFVLDIERDWEAIGRAHSKWFQNIRPAATMIQISKLIHPDHLLEIEVSAVTAERSPAD